MLSPRHTLWMLAIASVLLTEGAAAADATLDDNVAHAKKALVGKDIRQAGRDLRTASDYLEKAAVNASEIVRIDLEVSAREMRTLAESAEGGIAPEAQRIDDAAARAGRALANAQSPQAGPAPQSTSLHALVRDLGSDFKHLPSRDSLIVLSIGGAGALAVHPADSSFNAKLANDGGVFKAGNVIGNSGTLMGAAAATYFLGRATGHSKAAHVGLDLLRAQIVTEAMVESLKYTVRRPRPDGSSGFSFPSGHSAMTFATAAVFARHHGWKWGIPVYAFASYVAASRLHDNVHNLSDVVFGAAVGTIAGRTVTRHGATNFAIVPLATPGGGKGLAFIRSW